MQHLIEKFISISSKSVCTDAFSKQKNQQYLGYIFVSYF